MFRKEDRAAVEDWLSRLENQSIHTMICGNAKRAYTIVHSWADADQGNFPAPEGMAAFTVKEVARKELARLVAEEKENRTIPFPAEEYCEEYCRNKNYNSVNYTTKMLLEDWDQGHCRFWAPIPEEGNDNEK